MNKILKFYKLISDKDYRVFTLGKRGFYHGMSDAEYISRVFRYIMGVDIDLNSPKTFNEKLNWLKLNDRNIKYSKMVDKVSAKKIIEKKLGNRYVIPTLCVCDSFDEIPFDRLPEQFVIKCTHNSGGIVICTDKSQFDYKKARKKINHYMRKNYFWSCREWPYKNVKPRIVIEKYVNDGVNDILPVYKFFNFNNGATILQVIHGDKSTNECIDYFDDKWNHLNIHQNFPNHKVLPKKPNHFDEMLQLSKKLSKGMPFLRTDFYVVGDNIYFSEFTFYSDAGLTKFYPDKWDVILGNRIKLPIEDRM